VFISFSSVFATYTISRADFEKVKSSLVYIQKVVDWKYHNIQEKKIVYHNIVDSIDLYILLHKNISERTKVMLLCIKTYILRYLWYKLWNPIFINIVNK